jgi:hypothetical protein
VGEGLGGGGGRWGEVTGCWYALGLEAPAAHRTLGSQRLIIEAGEGSDTEQAL